MLRRMNGSKTAEALPCARLLDYLGTPHPFQKRQSRSMPCGCSGQASVRHKDLIELQLLDSFRLEFAQRD